MLYRVIFCRIDIIFYYYIDEGLIFYLKYKIESDERRSDVDWNPENTFVH